MGIEHKNDGWPNKFSVLPNPFKAVGKCVLFLFEKHQLASHGDHSFENRGAAPILDEMLFTENISGACDTTIDLTETVPEETQLMLDYWTVEP